MSVFSGILMQSSTGTVGTYCIVTGQLQASECTELLRKPLGVKEGKERKTGSKDLLI